MVRMTSWLRRYKHHKSYRTRTWKRMQVRKGLAKSISREATRSQSRSLMMTSKLPNSGRGLWRRGSFTHLLLQVMMLNLTCLSHSRKLRKRNCSRNLRKTWLTSRKNRLMSRLRTTIRWQPLNLGIARESRLDLAMTDQTQWWVSLIICRRGWIT